MTRFHPFEVNTPHVAYTVLGGFVVFFGMFSLLIREKLYIGEAVWATLFGIIIGPYCAGIFDPRAWSKGHHDTMNEITLEVTRVVLAIGVFAIGVELPKQYMKRHWKSLFFLLVPVMTYGWFVSAALIYALIPGLTFLSALVVAACLTPTDPILAAAIVGGKFADKHVPTHLQHLLAAESGCNDGAAFPFLYIAMYLSIESSDAKAIGEWFYITWLYDIALGTLFGSLLGVGFRHLMKFCEKRDLIDRKSYVAQYVSLAILSIGATTLLGSDDLLAAFACGTGFAWDGWFNKQTEESMFSNVIDLLFNCACFIFIGAWIPFSSFNNPILTLNVWRLIVLALLILMLRRMPAIVLLYRWIPDIKTLREAIFSGHFGPMGVGAVFISTLAVTSLPEPHDPPESQMDLLASTLQPIVAFMVLCSIAVHGLSIPFFNLGRRVHSISHTWSRQRSMDTSPEWANQTRRVTKAEDIVINRDIEDKLERGEAGGASIMLTSSPRDSTDAITVDGDGAGSGTASPSSTKKKDEIMSQWREGQHLVIERNIPGEDEVEVEVIPHAFDSNNELNDGDHQESHLFRGTEDAVKDEIKKHLRHLEQQLETGLEHALGCTPKASMERQPERDPEWKDEPIAEGEMLDASEVVDVEDVDEQAHTPSKATSSSAPTRPRSRSIPSKTHQSLSKLSGRPTGRRRDFARKVLLQHYKQQSHPQNTAPPSTTTPPLDSASTNADPTSIMRTSSLVTTSPTEDTSRGRRPHTAREHPTAFRLKLEGRRRESSPARSIRFADQEMDITTARSGYTTPVEPDSGTTTPLGSYRSQSQNQILHEQLHPSQGQE